MSLHLKATLVAVALANFPIMAPMAQTPGVDAGFWLSSGNTQRGPFDADALRAFVADGTLTAETQVWTDGMAGWAPAETVAVLAPLLAGATHPPAASPGPGAADPAILHGTWLAEGPVPMQGVGQAFTRLVWDYRDGGVLRVTGSLTMGGKEQPVTMEVSGTGHWTAERGPDGLLRVTTSGHMQITPLGGTTQSQIFHETATIEVIDQDTLRDQRTGMLMQRSFG